MKKLAIIGASYLQEPLIRKAQSMGLETHVFAWKAGDIGEEIADYFYPISIVEKESILEKCREIGIDGICSIASDLAVITVNYVANAMGLVGNSMESVAVSTNKHNMRMCFERNCDPSPKSVQVRSYSDLEGIELTYPVIVKPVDRSGSRGITELHDKKGLEEAINNALDQGFEKAALVEEFVTGKEYSVEFISWEGEHRFLALTQKYTTGAPGFIETGHLEPADVKPEVLERIKNVVVHALNSLGVKYGASHSELKISESGDIKLIEIGARMGGDNIGAALVELSTGYDFVKAVVETALGIKPSSEKSRQSCAGIRFVFSQEDMDCLEEIKKNDPQILVEENVRPISGEAVTDSSTRFGYYMMKSDNRSDIEKYMPIQGRD